MKEFQKKRIKQISKEFRLKKIVVMPNDIRYNGMVILKNIEFTTRCEHHLVSIRGVCHFGYIPGKYLIGLSQIARIIEYFLNPATEVIQERANKELADYFQRLLKPRGLILVIKARHDCVSARGVRQRNVECITSEIRGNFRISKVREEFLKLIV